MNHFCQWSVHRFHSVYSELFNKEEAKLVEKQKFATIFFEIFLIDVSLIFKVLFELLTVTNKKMKKRYAKK